MFWNISLLVVAVGCYAYWLYKSEVRLQEIESNISELNQKTTGN